ncbi:MAG: tetratricopeptide repeat protein [Candidatus Omnitrophica bacterium]|nr:tetratricopeptide repeat protein [Candidatus Omnitrophota bacterium]
MRSLSISLLCFLFICNLSFLSPVCAEASNPSTSLGISPEQSRRANISKESIAYNNYLKGLLFDDLGEYEQAKDAYQKAIKSDFKAWDIHYRLALDYVRLQDFKRAEKEFRFLLESKPYNEKIRFLLALVYSYRSKYKAAVNEYHKLLQRPLLELDETDVRYSLAQLYFMQEDLDKAEEEYKTILESNPDDSYAHFYLGYIYSESSKTDAAIKEFNQALKFDPANPLALNALSYLYAELGENLDQALALVQKALELEPSNGAYLDTLGWIYFRKGDLDKAIRYLENASVMVEDAEIFEHLGDVYFKIGKSDEALKNWQRSLQIDPKRKQVRDKIRESKKNK